MMSWILIVIVPCLIPQVTRCHQPDSVHLQMKSDTTVAADKFKNYSVSVRFDMSVDIPFDNKNDPRYIAQLKTIQKTLAEYFNQSIGKAFYSITVVRLRNGSVIADTELQVNENKTNNPDGQVANGLEDLANIGSLTVNGSVWNISEVIYNNKTACPTNTYGIQCTSNCTCNTANTLTCDSVNGSCTCKNGWNGTHCSEDIDECENSTICAENSTCNNSPGSFSCECNVGFFNSSGQCDACPEGTFGQECKSNCTCNTTNTMTCDKVNGSCTCKNGWNGTICGEDIDECQKNTVCSNIANSTCRNILGSYSCDCVPGFFKSGDVCYDQGCHSILHNCSQLCNNNSNSYNCSCLPGYTLNSDETTCDVCLDGTYGIYCSSTCTCNTSNTLTCDKANGACTCKTGWSGSNCSDDVNECQNSTICAAFANSSCNNLPGSYSCDCKAGFLNFSGQCVVCPSNTYGIACTSNCTCNTTNALTCDKVNGTCTCKNGWSGLTCDDDVDECQSPTVCNAKPDSSCTNSPGSHSCVCNSGFFESDYLCAAADKFKNYSVSVRFDVSVNFSLNDERDPRYIALSEAIQKSLAEHFNQSIGIAFYSIRVVRLRSGSVIAGIELQVNKDKTDNPDGQVAKGLEDLASRPSLTISGTVWFIAEVKYNDKTVTVSQNLCDTFYQVTSCSDGQVCDDNDSVPKCSQIKDSNYQLIIGLSVGIPLFFVLVIIIVVCVVYNYKRRTSAYDTPNKRRQDNPEYNDLHIPKRVVRTQGETTPQYNTVRTVGEVYAEIGDVPDYFPISHMSEHDYLRPIPLDTYNHGISTNITSQSNFRSGRSPAPDARSATSRENKASTYLHPTSAVYEGNGVHDLNYDSLRPVYYPTRPPTRNASNDREHRNYGGRRPTTYNIHRAHYK